MMKSLYFTLFMVFSNMVYAAQPITMTVDPQQKHFKVILPANPSTGYQWSLVSYDKASFNLLKSNYEAPNTQLIGAGGSMVFIFVPRSGKNYPAKTSMRFNYNRSWEKNGGQEQLVNINFVRSIP